MKNIAIILCTMIMMAASCKKNSPAAPVPEDLVIQILIQGEWSVIDYTHNGNNMTPDFAGWRFKYYANKTVDAKLYGNVMNTGTWDGSQATMIASANFPGASHPVILVNGNWSFTPVSSRIVDFRQTVGPDTKTMRIYRE